MSTRKKSGKAARSRGRRTPGPPSPRKTARPRQAAPTLPAAGPEHVPPQADPPAAAALPAPVTRPRAETRRRRPRTPEAAFDALYLHAADPLLRQIELLTGAPPFARHVVDRAFDLAWQRWPEVARDSDPVGWVRAAAYEYALAPWQRWTPGPRPQPRTPKDPLAAALLELPPAHRRVLLLHDGLGLGLPQAAAEVEASTHAAAMRISRAREALAEAVPELADDVPGRLGALLRPHDESPEPPKPLDPPEPEPGPEPFDRPEAVRSASERRAWHRTVGAFALTGLIGALTTVAIALTPAFGTHPRVVHPDVPAASKPIRDRVREGVASAPTAPGHSRAEFRSRSR